MRAILLSLVLLAGCFTPGELYKAHGQDEAEAVLREHFRLAGLELQEDLYVFWHRSGGCLPDLPLGSSTPEGRCRAGRAVPILGWACIVEVSWLNRETIWLPAEHVSDTSLPHELLHCALEPLGDPGHESAHWSTTLPAAVRTLRAVGL